MNLSRSLSGGYFIENRGQVLNDRVRFYAAFSDVQAGFERGRILYNLLGRPFSGPPKVRQVSGNLGLDTVTHGLHMQLVFEGSNPVEPQGRAELPFRTNYFVGANPEEWRTNLRAYREVVYEGLYDGIDLIYRWGDSGVKYEFLVHPGSDPARISVAVEGAVGLRVAAGALVLATTVGDLVDTDPVAYQDSSAPVSCGFALRGRASYGFECGAWDTSRVLVIDPLVYSTFVGGSTYDTGSGVAVDSSGNAYLTGAAFSVDFPVTPGGFDTTLAVMDAFLAKLDPTGSSLVYATFLGGSSYDQGISVAVDSSGNAYVTGTTSSTDFPTTPGAPDSSANGGMDAFVAKLNATGASLVYGTYIGGSGEDDALSIAVDAGGAAVIAGRTESSAFPTTIGAFDTSFNGWWDGFAVKVNPAGTSLVYSTFLGGTSIDLAEAVAIDSGGNAIVAGQTDSADFPTTPGAYDTSYNNNGDVFVARLPPTGSNLVFSTFIGGLGQDEARSVTVDSSGSILVGGDTTSADFPVTPAAFQRTYGGNLDGIVLKLMATGASLSYATYLGGISEDAVDSIAAGPGGAAFVVGNTLSSDFPTTGGAFDTSYNDLTGFYDAFVGELDSTGSSLVYGTYFGGSRQDGVGGTMGVDSTGAVVFAGFSESPDFPITPGAFDVIQRNGKAFVAKLRPIPSVAVPALAWTGEPNYVADGVDPQLGGTTTSFTYRVVYSDADNDPPVPIQVRVEKPLGSTWGTFRMNLGGWVGAPFDYVAGSRFTLSTRLSPSGLDYQYAFNATDGRAWARGPPVSPTAGPVVDDPPTALASPSKTVTFMGDPIVFTGSGSSDDFGVVRYLWSFGDGTTDSSPVATHSFSSRAPFTVVLTVWDARNQSDNDTLDIEIRNRSPVANAGADQVAAKNTVATLNGSGSLDPDSDRLTYRWAQTAGPPVSLAAGDTPSPSFTPTAAGMFVFGLTVDDGWGGVANDSVTVTVQNRAPVSNAGPDQTTNKRAPVTLDGTASRDPDGDSLRFSWVQTGGPSITLSGNHTPNPAFVPDISGTYVFELTVDDGDSGTSSDSVQVTVTNRRPVADTGRNQSSWKRTVITLDGSPSTDPDGDALTFWWEQIGGPYVLVNNATSPSAWIFPLIQGTYTFRLHVDDGDSMGADAADVSVVVWSRQPIAGLMVVPDTARVGAIVHFDGTASFDPDGSIVDYLFRFGDGSTASGSTALEDHPYSATGTYVATLTVTDDDGNASSLERSVVIVANLPPLATLAVSPGPTGTKATLFRFDGLNSTDPDGTIASWSWAFGDGATSAGAQVSHRYARSGSFTATLTVTDNEGGTDTGTLVVSVGNRPPQIVSTDPVPSVSIDAGEQQTLTVTAMDPDGDPLTYAWRIDGANVGGNVSTYVLRRDAAGTYRANVTVSDGEAQAASEWTVTVVSAQVASIASPMFWALIAVAVVTAVIIFVLVWRRRRKSQPVEAPADGR